MRAAHLFPLFQLPPRAPLRLACLTFLALAAMGAPLAQGQTAPATPSAPHATAHPVDPAASGHALQHTSLPASDGLATPSTDWRAAHAAVGAFPRGHADVLRWEAAQRATANTGPAAAIAAASPQTAMPHAAGAMAADMPMGQHGTAAPAGPDAASANTPAGTPGNAPAPHHGGQP